MDESVIAEASYPPTPDAVNAPQGCIAERPYGCIAARAAALSRSRSW
jgi:hypothetical protein